MDIRAKLYYSLHGIHAVKVKVKVECIGICYDLHEKLGMKLITL